MASIVGEWHNADASLASINNSIAIKTQQLDASTANLAYALKNINTCGNVATGCLSKTGKHINSWRDIRNQAQIDIGVYQKDLQNLLALQKEIAGSQAETAAAAIVTANATASLANASAATTGALAKKWLLYGGIALVVIIGGIFAYKYFKRKK
jgi:hypothetical protein